MGNFYGGEVYSSAFDITGPSGFYAINTPVGPVVSYVDQDYDGGGWVQVLSNTAYTGGMNDLNYFNAVNTCNFRNPGTNNGSNTSRGPRGLSGVSGYNSWIGTKFWSYLAGRVTSGKVMVVQFVATSAVALGSTGSHTKRYRWRFDNFNSTYGFVGATGISDETSTGSPGFYNYHAANGFSLTTYDNDQDAYGSGNCSTFYNNNPFWYGGCWSGNYFGGGGGYQDAPYWDGSGGDYHNYGAVYIK
jgi:hypothetical protein